MSRTIEVDFLPQAFDEAKEKPRILIIDNNRDFTYSAKLALERTGRYSVWEENEPARAHRTAQRVKPDVILLDIAMPETDGGEVAARIESDPALHRTPVVFLTALVTKAEARLDGLHVTLTDGKSISASTLIWTAGVKPSPVIAPLPSQKERGRLSVNEFLGVPGVPGLWAAGDCAAVPDSTGKFHPPTAQHGLREGLIAAKNIEASILGRPPSPFVFTTLGQLATIGRRTGVAMISGMKFSGFVAWGLWRMVYLMKLPRLPKKLRVMVGWTLDLLFARDIEQMITLRDVEAVSELAGRIRARATQQQSSLTAASTPDTVIRNQI